MPSSPHTMSLAAPQNLADDIAHSMSVRYNQVFNKRPLWTIHVSIDQLSFYIGAIGSVFVGYALHQYEPMNIDNVNYIETGGESQFSEIVTETITHPLAIVERFFLGGAIYVGIGLVTEGVLHVTKPPLCGLLTGLYFSYGYPVSSMAKMSVGFALFATGMEAVFYLFNRN